MYRKITSFIVAILLISTLKPIGLVNSQGDTETCPLEASTCELWGVGSSNLLAANNISFENLDLSVAIDTESSVSRIEVAGDGAFEVPETQDERVAAQIILESLMSNDTSSNFEELRLIDGQVYVLDGSTETWERSDDSADITATLLGGLSPTSVIELINTFTETGAVEWQLVENSASDDDQITFQFAFNLSQAVQTGVFINQLSSVSIGAADANDVGQDTVRSLLSGFVSDISNQLADDTLIVDIVVDSATERIRQINLELDADFNLGFLETFVAAAGNASIGDISFLINLSLDITDYDSEISIVQPEDWIEGNSLIDFGLLSISPGQTQQAQVDIDPNSVEFSISYDETLSGTLSEENFQDFYELEAEAGDIVTITARAIPNDDILDLYLYLYDSEGVNIAENDDALNNPDVGFYDSEIYEFEISESGSYIIEVTWLYEVPDHDYELTVQRISSEE